MSASAEISTNVIMSLDVPATPMSGVNSFPAANEKKLGKIEIFKDFSHYFCANFVVFEVDGRLFRVPTHLFLKESPNFSEIYKLKSFGEGTDENSHSHSVIKLNGIRHNEFKCLLKVLYPLNSSLKLQLSEEEWISVLSISSEWRFLRLREMAIAELGTLTFVKKIRLGRTLYISSWVVEALSYIVLRTDTITDEEAINIDATAVTTVYKLHRLRESRIANNYLTPTVKSNVEETFKNELALIREKEKEYQVVNEGLKLMQLEQQQRDEEQKRIKQRRDQIMRKKEREKERIRKEEEEEESERLEKLQIQISNASLGGVRVGDSGSIQSRF